VTQSNSRKAKTDTPEYAEVKQSMVEAAIELLAEKGLRKFPLLKSWLKKSTTTVPLSIVILIARKIWSLK
jgi:hypothetical protein